MKSFLVAIGSFLLLAVAAFCVFGFLATFEPTDNAMEFRIGYTLIGLGCLGGVGLMFVNVLRND